MNEGQDALQQADALIQMNQAGFIDGYMKANNIRYVAKGVGSVKRERKLWERIKEDWKEAFDRRFKKGVIKDIKILTDDNQNKKS